MTNRDAALEWARRGWRVFPCKAEDKRPYVAHDGLPHMPPGEGGFKLATRDPEQIKAWHWPLIGGVPGSAELVVLDIDRKAGASLADVPADGLETRRHRTQSGGWHLIYKARPGAYYGNGARLDIAEGIDVRHDSGYVILPPSSGYALEYDVEPTAAPAWLEQQAERKSRALAPSGDPIPRGQQDERLFEHALYLLERGLDREMAAGALYHVMQTRCVDQDSSDPWTLRHAEAKIASAARYVYPLLVAIRSGRLTQTAAEPDYLQPTPTSYRSLAGMKRAKAEPYGGLLNIPRGTLSILTGQQGTGKGLLACAEAAHLTHHGHGVVFIGNEDAIAMTVLPRLVAAGADLSRVYMPDIEMDEVVRLPRDVGALAEHCAAHAVRLVVVDPWTNHMGDIDVNKGPEVRTALMALKRAAEVGGFSVILTAHPNKNSDNPDPLERVAHASAITQVARSAFWIVKDPEHEPDPFSNQQADRLVCHVKANLTGYAGTMRYRLDVIDLAATDDEPADRAAALRHADTHAELDWLAIHDLIKQRRQRAKPTATNAAGDWLFDYLAKHGSARKADVIKAGLADGHTQRTLERAASERGVRVEQHLREGATWSLS